MGAAGLGDWPGRNCSVITGVNNRGDLVGTVSNEEVRDRLSFMLPAGGRLDDGTAIDLATAFGRPGNLAPVEINDSGQVLCTWGLSNHSSVVLLSPEAGGRWSSRILARQAKKLYAVGMNGRGWTIGTMTEGGRARAFLWTGETLVELDRSIPPGSGFKHLGQPVDINERGDIVGTGAHTQAQRRAWMLCVRPASSRRAAGR
jgi:hypothetical protein